MNKKALLAAGCALAILGFGSVPASAATSAQLTGVHGNVLVDSGKGFVLVTEGAELKPGDRVMVAGDGGGTLTFGPGCSTALASDSMTTFTGDETCEASTQGDGNGNGSGLGMALLGTAVVGGGAAAAVIIINNNDNNNNTGPQS